MSQQPPYGQPPYRPPGGQPPYRQPPRDPPPGGQAPWPEQPASWNGQPQQQPYPPQYSPPQYQQQYVQPPSGYNQPPPKQKKRGFLGGLGLGCLIAIGIVVIGVIAVIVIISSAANGVSKAINATATPFNQAAIAQLNQTVSVPNWGVTATGVEKPGKTLTTSQFGNTSTAAGTWVIVAVDLKNTGTKNFGVNDPDFQLKDSAGNTYNVSSDLAATGYSTFKGGQQIGGQVPPGTTVRYYIPFDVAPSATGLVLQFEQGNKPLINLGQNAS